MSPPIGFALLVNPRNTADLKQNARLIARLNRMFDSPPIAVHHDFSQLENWLDDLPPNVRLVRPHLRTRWGHFSCIEAATQAIRLLYGSGEGPDWMVYLSGTDYPIKPAEKILSDLAATAFDAHLEYECIEYGHYAREWQRLCHKRYRSVKIPLPGFRGAHPAIRHWHVQHPAFTRFFLPFDEKFRCYAGDPWFYANRRAARFILQFHDEKPALKRHYANVQTPEESYFNTILANAPELRLGTNNFRYSDWSQGGSNPKTLGLEDLPALRATDAHFARKFDPNDTRLQDRIDEITA